MPVFFSHTLTSWTGLFPVERGSAYCPPPFRRKVEGHCFWFSVGRGAWRVARGAWRVVRGAWFRVFSGYFVPLTPPTVSVRSF